MSPFYSLYPLSLPSLTHALKKIGRGNFQQKVQKSALKRSSSATPQKILYIFFGDVKSKLKIPLEIKK
jgi:hypothetical protein